MLSQHANQYTLHQTRTILNLSQPSTTYTNKGVYACACIALPCGSASWSTALPMQNTRTLLPPALVIINVGCNIWCEVSSILQYCYKIEQPWGILACSRGPPDTSASSTGARVDPERVVPQNCSQICSVCCAVRGRYYSLRALAIVLHGCAYRHGARKTSCAA